MLVTYSLMQSITTHIFLEFWRTSKSKAQTAATFHICMSLKISEIRLRKCTNLREFQFASCYSNESDTDLASYILPSIEKLTLSFTRSLPFLGDFDDWIKHASDPTWLPHLKSFRLTIESCRRARRRIVKVMRVATDIGKLASRIHSGSIRYGV